MERDRDYHITHRPSRLRNPFPRLSPDRGVDSARGKHGYRRNGVENYNGTETSYREDVKREYGTRYRRYVAEDTYARQYNRIPSYSRKMIYGDDYVEYNTRSRHYAGKDSMFADARYTESATTPLARTNTRANSNHRNVVHDVKSARRTISRWDDAGEDVTRPIANTNGKMQLRYGGRRRRDTGMGAWQEHEEIDSGTVKVEPTERVTRTRILSPRNSQLRGLASRTAEGKDGRNHSAEINMKVKVEIDSIKSEESMAIKCTAAKGQQTDDTCPAIELSTVPGADADKGEVIAVAESATKRKRGRPKGVKSSTRQPAVSKRSITKETTKGETDMEPEVLGTAQKTPQKRVSDRIRSNPSVSLYAINTRRTEDAYEEQLKKVIAMSIKDNGETPKATTKTRSTATDTSNDSITRTKQSSISGMDDDDNDLDYVPMTPTSQGKTVAKKTRAKGTLKAATPKKVSKTPAKSRVVKRSKEATATTVTTEPQPQAPTLVQPAQDNAVAVVNDGVGSAKMLLFEEYLDMSERMYCGKPLCVRGADGFDVKATDEEHGTSGQGLQSKQEIPNGEVPQNSTSEEIATTDKNVKSTEVTTSENKQSTEQTRDELFEFQCANLDLRFRVSFAMLTSELRQSQMLDLWGPKELVLFELGMFKHGKEFHEIQRIIPTKTVQEIVDMYYFWKKTNRYKLWKANRQY